MAKTTFSSGVIVTSAWLNGSQQIYFDDQDLDWHFARLGLNSFVRSGPNGLDSGYVSLDTEQPQLGPTGGLISGIPISGGKVVTGLWNFGYDPLVAGNPPNVRASAPKSFTTNDKYNFANGTVSPNPAQRFAALDNPDLVTKRVLQDWVEYLFDTLELDNGIYESAANPACVNYSLGVGNTDTICPL